MLAAYCGAPLAQLDVTGCTLDGEAAGKGAVSALPPSLGSSGEPCRSSGLRVLVCEIRTLQFRAALGGDGAGGWAGSRSHLDPWSLPSRVPSHLHVAVIAACVSRSPEHCISRGQ